MTCTAEKWLLLLISISKKKQNSFPLVILANFIVVLCIIVINDFYKTQYYNVLAAQAHRICTSQTAKMNPVGPHLDEIGIKWKLPDI